MAYDFKTIEKKWQDKWDSGHVFAAETGADKPKFYGLIEFPYPSGEGLHVGHPRPYTAMDIVTRKRRKQGYNTLFPVGFDSFGLPTENYAIKNKIHPSRVTKMNIATFTAQLKMLGYGFDWDRVIDTSDPAYYKWTQWIFIKMFENGLAYKAKIPVNWCTSCRCVLANEEVVDGHCERCGAEVVRREKSQWMLRITKYAGRLLDDLDSIDLVARAKLATRNWIGRSSGAEVDFETTAGDKLRVFTTRPDTLFGATYMVISPEHAILGAWENMLSNKEEIRAYQVLSARKSDFERTEMAKEKTGVRIDGVMAINPVTGGEIPIFISDYVLATYGTGAIMAVPGHDTRDWEFAKKFDLPIVEVVAGGDISQAAFTDCDTGILVNSGFMNGLSVEEAKKKVTTWLEEHNLGKATVNYKLRDWVFSRQRYWGEPIPMVYCDECGWVTVPESELPLKLPDVESYETNEEGESPLADLTEWLSTTCPKCGRPAKRETDTMPNWAGSNWYYLRYTDPRNSEALASKEALDYWTPVDWYNGGMEHTTLHFLYSRFCHKFLYDIGVVPTPEPYKKRTSHGFILAEDGSKMSKSRGNVLNPNEPVEQYGADTMRLYVMFLGDFEKDAPWSNKAIKGCKRFLDRVYGLFEARLDGSEEISAHNEKAIHRAIKKVSSDIEDMKFNTAIAAMMSLVSEIKDPSRGDAKAFLGILSPFAPHICDELWEIQGFENIASLAPWPEYDEAKTLDDVREIAVQVGGKLKTTVKVAANAPDEDVLAAAKADPKIARMLENGTIIKTIVVPNRLINLIIK